jgi:hypothetical protein
MTLPYTKLKFVPHIMCDLIPMLSCSGSLCVTDHTLAPAVMVIGIVLDHINVVRDVIKVIEKNKVM